jgi:glucose-6-phosphate 1-dehydrogenase
MVDTHFHEGSISGNAIERLKDPCLIVLFGASGDLTKRLLMPALYNLASEGLLNEKFAILGTATSDLDTDSFRKKMTEDIHEFATQKVKNEIWEPFCNNLYYTPADFSDLDAYRRLAQELKEIDEKHGTKGNYLFYFAVPQTIFAMISKNLHEVGLTKETGKNWPRVVLEKPFGFDLESALELNKDLHNVWNENQIWRIDHYLGKETVQNILAFRFANGIFEPLWNRNYIDHIQFTAGEKVGVEGRISYYDKAGVLRDMIQNHMFQVLSYIAMEPPRSFNAEAIRNAKVELLKALRIYTPEEVLTHTKRGQYGPGAIEGKGHLGYREEEGIPPNSTTETFAALKLFIENWRWQGVPFYLRSGKCLPEKSTEIVIQFKRAPHAIFRDTGVSETSANKLIFHIQPKQGIELIFDAKIPGQKMELQTVHMHFEYKEAFSMESGTGYETLLHDCMNNEATLFPDSALVETSWRAVQPIIDVWNSLPPRNFPNYSAGTWGPKSIDNLMGEMQEWSNPSTS